MCSELSLLEAHRMIQVALLLLK